MAGRALLLSVDFEDWHQLVRRRVGASGWERPGPALARQTDALLALLGELGVRCTFFILGMAARAHPSLVRAVAAAGHEIGCHGDQHRPVFAQAPAELAADLRTARETIGELTGAAPAGYRAPAFSIAPWAYQVLAAEGFAYDSSQVGGRPHRLEGLTEFPVARAGRLPVGGASYWALLPTPVVLGGLERAGEQAGLYLHPHELDPEPLKPLLAPGVPRVMRVHAALRATQRNSARRRAPGVLRAIARRFDLIPYGEAHAQLDGGAAART